MRESGCWAQDVTALWGRRAGVFFRKKMLSKVWKPSLWEPVS